MSVQRGTEDVFWFYDLKVEVVAGERPMVCNHRAGDYFLVEGENLVFSRAQSFPMYALAAILLPVSTVAAFESITNKSYGNPYDMID